MTSNIISYVRMSILPWRFSLEQNENFFLKFFYEIGELVLFHFTHLNVPSLEKKIPPF